jgi:hypothetical protein
MTKIIYPEGNLFPEFTLISENIKPAKVSYWINYFENGILKYGDSRYDIECILDPLGPLNGNVYILKE